MKIRAIHQFSHGVSYGDGITNGIFFIQKILKNFGFESKIYSEIIDSKLNKKVLNYKKFDKEDEASLLIVHYSLYYDFSIWIDKLPQKKIMIYHNITPHSFFEKSSPLYELCKKGREIIPDIKKYFIASIGDSPVNSKELTDNGYEKVETIALLSDNNKKINAPFSEKKLKELKQKEHFKIFFIGRIAPNKHQHDLILIIDELYNIADFNFKLYIIGGATDESYLNSLQNLIKEKSLDEVVEITGKISNEELYAFYRTSDLFLCMSEHEGFGIPLLEAMLFGVPVIAYDSSNIKNTLNGGGILFKEKNYQYIANTISLLAKNRNFKRAVIERQYKSLEIYDEEYLKDKLVDFLNSLDIEFEFNLTKSGKVFDEKRYEFAYKIEGPFDSSYSLALLNREMAKALNSLYPKSVFLHSTEGGGDFEPNRDFLSKNLDIKDMWENSKKSLKPNVLLRNLYPPRVKDSDGLINLMNSYGWEESEFPQEYVKDFNKYLDAIPVMSNYVKKLLIANGVKKPIHRVGVGVDHLLNIKPKKIDIKTKKSFKFLHISSCFPRKGAEILVEAYCQEFSEEDDVCLIIKTFPNPHNEIEKIIAKFKTDNSPEIELINKDLSDEYIVYLYQNTNALVSPTKGEGFGLPMAEAMLFNLPVITTAYSGQIDFCNEKNSWLIDYSFEKAKTHMNQFNSCWVKPNATHLQKLMREVFTLSKEEIEIKTKKAKENILNNYKWIDCAKRVIETVDIVKSQPIFENEKEKIAFITTWNSKCGIATYSKFLVDNLKQEFDITIFANKIGNSDILDKNQEKKVYRLWNNNGDKNLNEMYQKIIDLNIRSIVIQFNFGFFNLYVLEEFIKNLKQKNIKIFITFHSVSDVNRDDFKASLSYIPNSLKLVNNILVHNIDDLNILKSFGVIENVTLFPHGVLNRNSNQQAILNLKKELNVENKKIIASYGFMLPHKGILELIEAFNLIKQEIKNTHLLLVNALYPNPISDEYLKECQKSIKKYNLKENITLITDFLEDEESLRYLDIADLIVLPYRKTQESSSASARYALCSKKPVMCTKQSIFNDVEDIVFFTDGYSPKEMAKSIKSLISNPKKLNSKNEIQNRWINTLDWEIISKRLFSIIKSS